jgi:hypothetical protein
MADLARRRSMKRILRVGSCLALALGLSACSTLTGDFHQKLQIDALDAQNRPVQGMQCQVGSGDSAKTVSTPASDVRVRRSAMSLSIECRRDNQVATAVVKPRRERMEEALLPFGSVGVFVDHLSGSLYGYPTTLHLRVGQHLVLEHGGEAQVATSEPIPVAAPAVNATAQPLEVASVQPAVAATPATSMQKPRPAAAPNTDRAVAKTVKVASSTAAGAKPRAPAPVAAPSALASSGAPARSAPVNW